MDCREFLGMLADSARAAFAAFMNAIITSRSHPSPGGKIHHLTKHLMDYLNNLAGYCETFNLLLKDYDGEDPTFMSPDLSSTVEEEICDLSPIAVHFGSAASF
ncbi:hypothetical protein OIU85_007671 [Salix viminalis]|uniref:Exocyst subunit Exo70 family protein n=1 Tax=Salix viminalis TaxID=40686 RepID=A0A9Q0P990_SALVM|nr:hypothetical protein OIU85_007671 [Salix viminalis]